MVYYSLGLLFYHIKKWWKGGATFIPSPPPPPQHSLTLDQFLTFTFISPSPPTFSPFSSSFPLFPHLSFSEPPFCLFSLIFPLFPPFPYSPSYPSPFPLSSHTSSVFSFWLLYFHTLLHCFSPSLYCLSRGLFINVLLKGIVSRDEYFFKVYNNKNRCFPYMR